MGDQGSRTLQEQLETLAATLSGVKADELREAPVRQLLERIIADLETDFELLEEFGYFSLERACTKICDSLEKKEIERIQTFRHCGQDHTYHALQLYLNCPVCRKYPMKTGRLFGEEDIRDVAYMVLLWLHIDPRTIPGWNTACDREPFSDVRA